MNDLALEENLFLPTFEPGINNPIVEPLTMELKAVGATLHRDKEYILISTNSPRKTLSSAIYNGGMGYYEWFINIKVDMTTDCNNHPAKSIEQSWHALNNKGPCFGMMTAASMNSMAVKTTAHNGYYFTTIVTTGLDNGRRVGDKADVDSSAIDYQPGTINMISLTNLALSGAAMVEAIAMMNETKSQVLMDMNIPSEISQLPITGTGTDSCGILSDPAGIATEYVGKHVIEGELLANSVRDALELSLAWNK